jgi:uncharacterized protein (TIGR03118 family)
MLHFLRSLFLHRWVSRPNAPVRPRRLTLETLEARTVPATAFVQTDLVSDVAGMAQITDPNLKNPWGVAVNPTGDFWVSNAATGTVTLYIGGVNGTPLTMDSPVLTVPGAPGKSQGSPSGQVFNSTNGFDVNGTPALFIVAGLDGTISAVPPDLYNGSLPDQFTLEATTPGAVYTGLAIASTSSGNFLYAANSAAGTIDVFNTNFQKTTLAGNFTDPNLGSGFTPFNIANINGTLYVTYESKTSAFTGGVVDKFNTNGTFIGRFADDSTSNNLNAPWGVVMAPSNFGSFSNDLLIGNFGDGHINAYNPTTGAFVGQLLGTNGQPIENDRLWTLTFGNGSTAGSTSTLYISAGINSEKDGLFASLTPTTVTPPPPPPAAPTAAEQAFVTQAYLDLLKRPVDASGLSFWSNQLAQGQTDQQVATGIESSTEFRHVEVTNLYQQYLNRAPDANGLNFWTTDLADGATIEQVAAGIVGSQEFFQDNGSTNTGFLDAIYKDALNRAPDSGGQAGFTTALQTGATREQVAAVVFTSDEFRADTVGGFYQTFLHRAADTNGLNSFVSALKTGATDEQVIAVIVGSPEYFNDAQKS